VLADRLAEQHGCAVACADDQPVVRVDDPPRSEWLALRAAGFEPCASYARSSLPAGNPDAVACFVWRGATTSRAPAVGVPVVLVPGYAKQDGRIVRVRDDTGLEFEIEYHDHTFLAHERGETRRSLAMLTQDGLYRIGGFDAADVLVNPPPLPPRRRNRKGWRSGR
jgi:hypothetical protein